MSLIEESSYVRIWLDKGKEQGRIEGEQKGRIEGEQKGRIEGEQKGRIEGVQKGKIEGKIEGERAIIVRLGRKRFGEPDAATLAKLDSIQSIERLDEISDRLISAANWNEAIGD
jgi:flagellar biosynthesis/type III secretory pathway protein FliH